jgi:lactoylglutathione lyase
MTSVSTAFAVGPGAIFETHVHTTDLERAMAFYGETLGLQLAYHLPQRSVAFYWIGAAGNAMLGVWETTPEAWHSAHFAFSITHREIDSALETMRVVGVEVLDFWGNPTDDPSVHAWMPACGIFFRDPDGNSLELVAMLPGEGRPDLGVIPLSEWYAHCAEDAVAHAADAGVSGDD